jgi:hypothetical protein
MNIKLLWMFYRELKQLEPVGLTAVRLTIKRLRHVIRKVRKRKQGNKDPSCPWAKARLRWVTQLTVRLGKHKFKHDEGCNKHLTLTSTPAWFYRSKLPPLSIHQITFWDEVHKDQFVGVTGDVTYAFPRDEDGVFDANGEVSHQSTQLHVKYTEQGRFCCGVACVLKNSGQV